LVLPELFGPIKTQAAGNCVSSKSSNDRKPLIRIESSLVAGRILGISHHLIQDGRIQNEWTLFDEFALLKQIHS